LGRFDPKDGRERRGKFRLGKGQGTCKERTKSEGRGVEKERAAVHHSNRRSELGKRGVQEEETAGYFRSEKKSEKESRPEKKRSRRSSGPLEIHGYKKRTLRAIQGVVNKVMKRGEISDYEGVLLQLLPAGGKKIIARKEN